MFEYILHCWQTAEAELKAICLRDAAENQRNASVLGNGNECVLQV